MWQNCDEADFVRKRPARAPTPVKVLGGWIELLGDLAVRFQRCALGAII